MQATVIAQLASRQALSLPMQMARVQAGFPSPAEDYCERSLDLNEHLIGHPAATFMLRAEGDSMVGAGIFSGDLLIVDRAQQARPGDVVIAAVYGELTVKRLVQGPTGPELHAENPRYPPILIREGEQLHLWGVVTASIRAHRRGS